MKPEPSPLLRWISPLAMAVWVGAVLARTQSSGAGQELHTPGGQLFFDALAFSALALTSLEALLSRPRWLRLELPLVAATVVAGWLLAAGCAAPDPELGWRTALSWNAAGALGLSAALLAAQGGRARWLGALLVASVTVGAVNGLHQYFVEFPALQSALESGDLPEIRLYEADFQQGLRERIHGAAATGPWLLPNMLACAISMVFPLSLAFALSQRGGRRVACGAACAVLLVALVATESKGGVLDWLASLGAFALLYPRWRHLRTKLLLAVAALGGVVAAVGGFLFFRAREAEGVGLSLTVRLEYWSAGWGMWTDAPWFGHGLNAFRALYPRYKLASAEETLHAHNGTLQLLVELGVLGCAVLLTALALWVWRAVRNAPDTELSPQPSHRWPLVGGLLLGALALLAGGDVLELNSLDYPLTLLGVGGLSWLFAEGRPISARLWRAALAAGAVGFLMDSLTNFGLHHAGCLVAVLVLAGLTRAGTAEVAEKVEVSEDEPPLGWALAGTAGLASLVALVAVFLAQSPLRADTARETGRALHFEGADLASKGKRLLATEALTAARAAYDEAIEAYPAYADSYRERAAVARALDDVPAAVADLERAVALKPLSATPHNELGHALLEQGDVERALVEFGLALERYPLHPAFLLDAAEARLQSADVAVKAEARGLAQRALEASDATRLQLRKLTPEQRARAEGLAGE